MIVCEGCYCDYGYKVDVVVRPILWKKVADNDCYCEGSYNSLSVLNGVGVVERPNLLGKQNSPKTDNQSKSKPMLTLLILVKWHSMLV